MISEAASPSTDGPEFAEEASPAISATSVAARDAPGIAGDRCPANSGTLAVAYVDLLAADGLVGIVGQGSPGNAMSKESDLTKLTRASNLVTGLRKHFKPGEKLVVGGVQYTRDEIIALFEEHTAAIDDKRKRYAAYRAEVARERKLARRSLGLYLDLHAALGNHFGSVNLWRFGMKEHGKPGPKTLQSKVAGVQKRAKKRASK